MTAAPGTYSALPSTIISVSRQFTDWIVATLVPVRCASPESVSPLRTRYALHPAGAETTHGVAVGVRVGEGAGGAVTMTTASSAFVVVENSGSLTIQHCSAVSVGGHSIFHHRSSGDFPITVTVLSAGADPRIG
jgi:hypothetical protein